jgi:3-methyl-2-oxobutanoate hydroxymethyltransferase
MRLTVSYFQKQKDKGQPITMLTAYDATSARLAERAGIETILVGDSLGMVVQGHQNTIPVTLEHILYHTQLVIRSTERPFVVADMPFMTYNLSPQQALQNAARCLQEGGAQAVKLEGGLRMAKTIQKLIKNGIPVLAHIGLTPQSVHSLGGWKVQGKSKEGAKLLLADAKAVEAAGAFAVVLELVPAEIATLISQQLTIPTIGIGAGPGCDGQVQVFHDVLGFFDERVPKHTKQYMQGGAQILTALTQYKAEVEAREFPTAQNAPSAESDILEAVYSSLDQPKTQGGEA